MNDSFIYEMEVRDYECDMQGIVNNSVYQNYLEHARHKYLITEGIDFQEYALKGINFVVIRAEIDYKFPLRGSDEFYVSVEMVRESRIKIAFNQSVFRKEDDKLIVTAKIIASALNERGRPKIPDELNEILDKVNDSL
jgi:acyl-CoA thioester hydrolase